MEDLVEKILMSMSSVKKAQQTFMTYLFAAFMVFQGKATMTHLSRYSLMSEKRFRRYFQRFFDFLQFNRRLLTNAQVLGNERIAAIDASFIKKSGNKTQGLGWFYNGSAGRMQKGLELSLIALIDIEADTAYALEAKQTIDDPSPSRMDQYAQQVIQQAPELSRLNVDYLVADAYYSKASFISKVTSETGLKIIGKLRYDSDLKWLYEGDYSGSGRPKQYDGKVHFDEAIERFDNEGLLESGIRVLSKVVYSVRFKRLIKVVMLQSNRMNKTGYVLLYSTDPELDSMKLIQYYRARFQIEFLFRDAKQQIGLTHCQSRKKESIHTHINSSLTVLNLLKVEDRKAKGFKEKGVISIISCKQRKFNQHFTKKVFTELGLDSNCEKVKRTYREMSDYGLVAA